MANRAIVLGQSHNGQYQTYYINNDGKRIENN